jgi:hypothetical protein
MQLFVKTNQIDWTIQVGNRHNFSSNKVAQAIQAGRENETVSNPNSSLHAF